MSLSTPTTKEISDNLVAQLEASLNQTIPLLPKAFNRVLAKALSAIVVLLYKYVGFMFLQMFVSTASFFETEVNGKIIRPLVEWGRLIGIGDPVGAVRAELIVDITVELQVGSLASGTQLIGADNGVTYLTIGAVLLNAATVQATVRASADQSGGNGAGEIGNLAAGAVVAFANPLANVARNTVASSQTVTGVDAESETAYRQRVIDRFQKRPQGGAYADYEQWAEETAGIINAYPYTSDCPGQVDVYCEVEGTPSTPDGVPTTAQLEAALALINYDALGLATRRPANALANTFPITRLPFNVVVNNLVISNLAEVQAQITAAIEEYFLDREPYIIGLSIPPRRDRITRTGVDGVVDDVVSAAGGIFGGTEITLGTVSVTAYSLGVGEKAKAASVVFA